MSASSFRNCGFFEPLFRIILLVAGAALGNCVPVQRHPPVLELGPADAPRTVFVDENGLADQDEGGGLCRPTTGLVDSIAGVYPCEMGPVVAHAFAKRFRERVARASSAVGLTTVLPGAGDDHLVFRIADFRQKETEKERVLLVFTRALTYRWEVDIEALAGGKVIKQRTASLHARLEERAQVYDGSDLAAAYAQQGGLTDIDNVVQPFVSEAVRDYEGTHPRPVLVDQSRTAIPPTASSNPDGHAVGSDALSSNPGSAPPVNDSAPSEATTHEARAKQHFVAQQWAAAAAEYAKAYAANRDPAFLFNQAACYRRLGDNQLALALYKQFVIEAPNNPNRALAEERIRTIEHESEVRK